MSDQLVTVESYQFLPEAEAVRMHLESEGLSAHLADAEAVSTEWVLANAIGNIKLRVPESQADAARAVLSELRSRRLERSQRVTQLVVVYRVVLRCTPTNRNADNAGGPTPTTKVNPASLRMEARPARPL
jgi:hypothetical protein